MLRNLTGIKIHLRLRRMLFQEQLPRVKRPLVVCTALSLLVLACAYVISKVSGQPLSVMTRDPAAVTHVGISVGWVSNLGVMAWAAAAAISLFGFAVLRSRRCDAETRAFLLASGLLSTVLLFDDTLLLHELVLPDYAGIPETAVYAFYGVLVLGYLAYFLQTILKTDYLLLTIAGFLLGFSLATDQLVRFSHTQTFVEDGFKFAGILFWLAYHSRAAFYFVSSRNSSEATCR